MLASQIPAKIPLPFASSGTKNAIPTLSQIGITAGAASLTDGFPPLTFTPLGSGGVPPAGADFNGIFNMITAVQQWQSAGGIFKYDATFSTSIGGYPKGSILMSTPNDTAWLNLADNNATNPDATDGSAANWAPLSAYGITAIAGLTNANVTLTPAQSGKPIITLSGTLTGNVQIIFPTTLQQWMVINNTTGAFVVTAKTAAGTGIAVPQGGSACVWGDGTNINQGAITQGQADVRYITLATGDGRYAPLGAGPIQGAFRNLAGSAPGTSAVVSYTIDELVTGDGAGNYQTTRAWNGAITMTTLGTGGLDVGVVAANSWYYAYGITKPDGTKAFIASLNSTGPSFANAAGYTKWARLGAFRTDGTANKYPLSFQQYGRNVQYKVAAGSNVAAIPLMASGVSGTYSSTAPIYTSVAVGTFIPPTAAKIKVLLDGNYNSGTASNALVAPNNAYGGPLSVNPPPMSTFNGGGFVTNILSEMLIESGNIYYASASSGGAVLCFGWEDNI